ncbi:MAG: site-2 protease family protein [Clostridia bacterium]|nr:site-2 protease family protein [Clostridia bacterium]
MLRNLYSLISGGADVLSVAVMLLSYAALVFLMLPVHEFAHAFAADKLGDNTPRWNGRLTLNPLKHLDVLGTVMLLLVGFGYARPVPVNPRNFRHPKRDMALTALAGPLSNLLMAAISLAIFRLVLYIRGSTVSFSGSYIMVDSELTYYLYLMLVQVFAGINIALAVFNLLPLYPLDGSRIFAAILPDRWVEWMERNQQIIMMVVLASLFFGVLDVPMHYLRMAVGWLLCTPLGLPNYFA